jgi:homoserine O-succinyltransferase
MTIQAEGSLVHDRPVPPHGRRGPGPRDSRPLPRGLRIAIVNNMPDGALVATERQFSGLVEMATGGHARIDLYFLPGLARGPEARRILEARYRPIGELYRNGTDGLVVTGNEPRAAQLDAEPYWHEMTQLTDWAKDNTLSTLWSCLAAHAAILHLDGISRRRLPGGKRSGVYACTVAPAARQDLPPSLAVCHSRLNEAPRDALLAAGYDILSESPGGHVDAFAKSWRSRFLFLQGHPEYELESLAREYRRDVSRYLNGQRDDYPAVPENYFDAATLRRLEEFRARAMAARGPGLLEAFPPTTPRHGLEARLAQSAEAVFRLWLNAFAEPALNR